MPTLAIVFLFVVIVLAILALINWPPGAQIVFLAVAVLLLALVLLLGHYGGRLAIVTPVNSRAVIENPTSNIPLIFRSIVSMV